MSLRKVILIELTCPAEEGIATAVEYTLGRHNKLRESIRSARWTPVLMTIEVGARGFVAHSVRRCFKKLGMPKRVGSLIKALSRVASRCSHAIYLSRATKVWDRGRELLFEEIGPSRPAQSAPVPPISDHHKASS